MEEVGEEIGLKKQQVHQTEQNADENVAAHQRIAPTPGQQPDPGDQILRPIAAHPRLQRQIEHPVADACVGGLG